MTTRPAFALISLAALACLTGTQANAQVPPRFEDLDHDGNGQISPAEAMADPTLDFAHADLDRNGRISRQEYRATVCRCTRRA